MYLAIALIGSAVIGAMGSQSAASTQAGGAQAAAQVSQNEFNTITGQEQPFMSGGYGALNQLDYLLGIGPQAGYQANPAINNANARGNQAMWGGNAQSLGNLMSAYGVGIGGTGVGPGAGQTTPLTIQNGNPVYGFNATAGQVMPTTGTPTTRSVPASGLQGSTAGGYGSLLSPFTADTFHQYSPAYQFQQQQGMQGTLNGDATGSGALSGAAQKDLISYNQNLANTSFNNAFSQYQTQQGNIYNRLFQLSNLGQNAAANTGMQGTQLAGNVGQAYANAAAAQAAGTIGAANAASSSLNSLPWLMYMQGGG